MISLPHILVKTYGGLHLSENPMFSGGGTEPPPKPPKAPVKKPSKKKK